MARPVSDIHEIAVIVGIDSDIELNSSINDKFSIFSKYLNKQSLGQISLTKDTFIKKVDLFDRGFLLAKKLIQDFKIEGNNLHWVAKKDIKKDSSDIYSDGIGISLKDNSKIVRNNGFEQLLNTFCKTTLKTFKDPFWEFSPSLSADFISTVIKSCYESGYLSLESNIIYIDNKKKTSFSGDLKSLLELNLGEYSKLFSKDDLKKLVKHFSTSGDLNTLFEVRKKLVKDVQDKVIAVLKEGLIQNPVFVGQKLKHLLQYREKPKYFGFSSKKLLYTGIIPSEKSVSVTPLKVYTEASKLTSAKTGLQINIYTDIEIGFGKIKNKISLQNQLRYKHRTFSCAPEANLHILSYDDWKKIYPDTITFS